MLQFCSVLIGENYNNTCNYQPSGKRKIILLGTCLLIPVILWFITAFLTSRETMNNSTAISLFIGLIAAFLIYLIERSIILSNGGWPIFIFRMLLGFVIACLGAVTLDSVVFKNDLDNKVNVYEKHHLDSLRLDLESNYSKSILDKKQSTERAYESWEEAERKYIDEIQGKSGNSSGIVGNGPIAKELKILSNESRLYYLNQASELKDFENSKNVKIEKALLEAKSKFNSDGLLIRIKALNELISEDSNLKKVYWLFTIFIFLMEFIVIIVKIGSKKSIDEQIENFRDYNTLIKLEQYKEMIKNNNNSMQHLPEVIRAKALLSGRK